MELRQASPPGRQVIQGYRDDGFTVGGKRFQGAVLVQLDGAATWGGESAGLLTLDHFQPLLTAEVKPELVIVGTGAVLVTLPPELTAAARAAGLKLEAMATPAACRTYNILLAENRLVAAALLPLAPPNRAA